MTRKQVLKKFDRYLEIQLRRTGNIPLIVTDKKLRTIFLNAVVKHGANGCKVHATLHNKGYDLIALRSIQRYVTAIFGGYTKAGRPVKYFSDVKRAH